MTTHKTISERNIFLKRKTSTIKENEDDNASELLFGDNIDIISNEKVNLKARKFHITLPSTATETGRMVIENKEYNYDFTGNFNDPGNNDDYVGLQLDPNSCIDSCTIPTMFMKEIYYGPTPNGSGESNAIKKIQTNGATFWWDIANLGVFPTLNDLVDLGKDIGGDLVGAFSTSAAKFKVINEEKVWDLEKLDGVYPKEFYYKIDKEKRPNVSWIADELESVLDEENREAAIIYKDDEIYNYQTKTVFTLYIKRLMERLDIVEEVLSSTF